MALSGGVGGCNSSWMVYGLGWYISYGDRAIVLVTRNSSSFLRGMDVYTVLELMDVVVI